MKFINALPRIGRYCGLGYITLALFCIIFVNPFIEYYRKTNIADFNILFAVAGLLLGIGLSALVYVVFSRTSLRAHLERPRVFRTVSIIFCLCLFIVEMLMMVGGWSKMPYDVERVTDVTNQYANSWYFSAHTHQVFLGGFFQVLHSLLAPILSAVDFYFIQIIGGCLGLTISVFLMAFIARSLGGVRAGVCALLLGGVFFGLVPYMTAPYTDTYSVPFLVGMLYCYVCQKRFYRWGIIAFLAYMGCSVKLTLVFVLLAILIVEACARIPSLGDVRCQLPAWGRALVSVIVGLVISVGLVSFVKSQNEAVIVPEWRIGPTHYLMLGFNGETNGAYNGEDEAFSFSFPDTESRSAGNLRVWQERIAEMGPGGIADLFLKKLLLSYSDGAFTWGEMYFNEINGQNPFVHWLYGIPLEMDPQAEIVYVEADGFVPWIGIAQCLWLLVLIGGALCWFRKRPSKQECAIFLALFLMSIYILCFEVTARYMLIYVPLFVIVAVLGWQSAGSWVLAKMRRKRVVPSSKGEESAAKS